MLLFVATLGNTFGGMTCFWIAKYGGKPLIEKWLKLDIQKLNKWEKKISGRGEWLALFCWIPFIGEIIASACGLVSLASTKVLLFMGLGKCIRYAIIIKVFAAI